MLCDVCVKLNLCVWILMCEYMAIIGSIDQALCKWAFVYMYTYSIDSMCVFVCADIDECTEGLAECSGSHSHCVNTAGGYFCQCKTGFSGDGQHCIGEKKHHLWLICGKNTKNIIEINLLYCVCVSLQI